MDLPADASVRAGRPSTWLLLRSLSWTMLRHPAATKHILGAISGSLVKLIAFRRDRKRARGRIRVALALVEHMGDIVAAEPIARLARSRFPGARISWFVRKPYQVLPDAYPEVDDAVAVQCMTEWLLLWSYGVMDVVWDLHISERRCPRCRAFFRKPGKPGRITYDTYYGMGNLLEVQCMSAGLEPLRDGPVLHSGPAMVRSVDALALPDRFVVIHTKSNDDARDWTDAKWAELAGHLGASFDGWVIEVGTVPNVIKSDAVRRRSLSGKLTVHETAEVIRRAELFVGIDSGPAHLANAVGTPGVILLGRYHKFASYMPYSGLYAAEAGATLLRADGLVATLPVDRVIQAVDRRLSRQDETVPVSAS